MVAQKYLIFDYDDTIMPSTITRKLQGEPDYGSNQVKDKLDVFYKFVKYWKNQTGTPIIILSAGTIAYMHLISLYGPKLRASINYFDPAVDICIFIPIPFDMITGKDSIVNLNSSNGVNVRLQRDTARYYQNVFNKCPGLECYSIKSSQLENAQDTAHSHVPDKSQREFINGISHRKISYERKPVERYNLNGCFYLPGFNYEKQPGLYEFMNCRRQFKNLDALRRHISFVTGRPCRNIHFYFFDDKASHLGMGDDDLYLSKPFKYPSTFFVGKIIPILQSLMDSNCELNIAAPRENQRRNENKLLNRLVQRLSKTDNLVFVAKSDGSSPISKRATRESPRKCR